MSRYMRLDTIRNIIIRDKVRVTFKEDKKRGARLRYSDHVKRRSANAPVRRCKRITLPECRRSRGRLRKSWNEVIRHDVQNLGLMGK